MQLFIQSVRIIINLNVIEQFWTRCSGMQFESDRHLSVFSYDAAACDQRAQSNFPSSATMSCNYLVLYKMLDKMYKTRNYISLTSSIYYVEYVV